MNERDDTNLSAEESISDEISERVRSVISAAESAATAIRHEAEQQAQIKQRAAEAERQRYIETAKAEAEALLEQRITRISELSDSLIEGAEAILMRIEGAQEVKRQLETMVHALAHAAEELAAESEQGRLAPVPRPVQVDDEPEPRMHAVPEPETEAEPAASEPDPANVTELRVPEPEPEPASEAEAPPEVTEAEAAAPAAEETEEEVEAHLRKTFALDEPGAILNDVFGTESKL